MFLCDRLHFFQVAAAISNVDGCVVIPLGIRGFFFGLISLLHSFSTLNGATFMHMGTPLHSCPCEKSGAFLSYILRADIFSVKVKLCIVGQIFTCPV